MPRTTKLRVFIGMTILVIGLTGCGTQTPKAGNNATSQHGKSVVTTKSSNGGTIEILGAGQYEGAKHLKHFESVAAANPQNAQAQINAAISARANKNDSKAIAYYLKAIKADPHSGMAYNNLGNIYLRDKNDAKASVQYYQKATKVEPTYGYGWLNLAIAEQSLGHSAEALATLKEALKVVPHSDPAYKSIKQSVSTTHSSP